MTAAAARRLASDDEAQLAAAYPGCVCETGADGIANLWVAPDALVDVLRTLKPRYPMLLDLSAIDERTRTHRTGRSDADYTVFYHLTAIDRPADVRVKVALVGAQPSVPTATVVWPAANWYEREAFDMFGIQFAGHPNLYRILTPPLWEGHPLRKDHPARATEFEPFRMTDEFLDAQQEALRFVPEQWGMTTEAKHTDFMFLNLGPNHPSVHGVFRIALQLDGEVVVDASTIATRPRRATSAWSVSDSAASS
jgi:NADH-quinone oxidoreductase subunit C/D